MKKVLILVSKKGEKKEDFTDLLNKYFKEGVEATLATFSDLFFEIRNGGVDVEIDGKKVSDYDLVYLRNTNGFQTMALAISVYLESAGIEFFDKAFWQGSFIGDKFTSLLRLAVNDVSVPDSIYCSGGSIEKYRQKIAEKLSFPLIAKGLFSQRMSSIYVIKNESDFERIPKTNKDGKKLTYIFQKLIDIDKEYRLLVLENRVGVVHTKTKRDISNIKINYADMNQYPVFLDLQGINPSIKDAAVKAANAVNIQIAGVDVCVEKGTGDIFVLEVNRGPGLEYDTDVSQEVPEIAKFFKNKLHR